MKYLALIPLVFVASCASRPQLAVRPAPPAAVAPVESLRYAEVARAYHVGRHIDPDHPETMHEEHPVYRIEVSSRWNLHPGSPNAANLLNPPPDAAFAPSPTNDALIAEMNRQREATALVMQQAARLAQSYQELQKVFGEMKTVGQNNALLNARLTATEERVKAFEKELQTISATPALTNDVPAFSPESNDSPKP
ncbi:MAG: hypothetical protein RLZZ350_828 [Verrucomicrobiota bacterium]|jgi:hypothetical protein